MSADATADLPLSTDVKVNESIVPTTPKEKNISKDVNGIEIINSTDNTVTLYHEDRKTIIFSYPPSPNPIKYDYDQLTNIRELYSKHTGATLIVTDDVGQFIKLNPKLWKGMVVSLDTTFESTVINDKGLALGYIGTKVWKIDDKTHKKIETAIRSNNAARNTNDGITTNKRKSKGKAVSFSKSKPNTKEDDEKKKVEDVNIDKGSSSKIETKTTAVETGLPEIKVTSDSVDEVDKVEQIVDFKTDDIIESKITKGVDGPKVTSKSKRALRNAKFISGKRNNDVSKSKVLGESESEPTEIILESEGKVALGYPSKK